MYLASVLEYLTTEIVELAGRAALDLKRTRVNPRHIMLAVRHDAELHQLLSSVTIAAGGVVPHIYSALLPKKSASKKNLADLEEEVAAAK